MNAIGTDIDYAAKLLKADRLVAFATETVYGLGANATSQNAVASIFAAKNRPYFDPLIVHIAQKSQLDGLVRQIPAEYELLIEHFWPGPLTLLFQKSDAVADLVTSGLNTVAIRMPGHTLARELIRKSGLPIAAPSANLFGRISPTTAQHVADQLAGRVDYILDGGPCAVGVESTIVRLAEGRLEILRHGGVTKEQLAHVYSGEIVSVTTSACEETGEGAVAPGMLTSHYAPQTRLEIVQPDQIATIVQQTQGRFGILSASALPNELPVPKWCHLEVLSEAGDLVEMASHFFAALRRLDESSLEVIYATSFPDVGLGRALNDRLTRAAAKR